MRDRLLDRGRLDVDRLKAPLERRIPFDVLAILVDGRRAHMQWSSPRARSGLSMLLASKRALGGAGAHDGM